MRLGKFAHTKMSRATSVFLTIALLLTLVPTFVLVNPKPALAAEYITNGDFESGSEAGWTITPGGSGNFGSSTQIAAPTGGGSYSLRGNTGNTRRSTLTHRGDYAFTYSGSPLTATLNHFWRKQNGGGAGANSNTINIYLSGPNDGGSFGASQRVWQHTGTGASAWAGSPATTNVLSRLSAGGSGSWTLRIEIIQENDDSSGQIRAGVDLLSLDIVDDTNNTTVGNGTDPSNATVAPGDTSQSVDSFSLVTDGGTDDDVTAITFTGSADTTSGSVSLAKLYEDNNGDGLLDAGDTLLKTATFSGNTATFSSLSITASTTEQDYLVAFDVASGAPDNTSLSGTVTAITSVNTKTYNDSGSATLTVDAGAPGTATQFLATDGRDSRVPLSWQNPSDSDFNRIRVLRRTDQYPTSASDGSAATVYEDTATASATENIVDTGRTNGQTYYYAAFTRDAVGNWNNTVTAGTTADTGTPNALMVGDSASSIADATVKGNDTNQEVGVFTMQTTGGSDTVATMTVTGGGGTGATNISAARLFNDAGTLGVLDAGDTTIASTSFSGSTATFTGLSISVNGTASNYLLTYDIAASPTNGAELTGYVSSATASVYEVLTSTDTADATLTVDSAAPGTVTGFSASDGDDQQSTLAWTNPGDGDLAEVKVVRKKDSYPTSHTDGTAVLDDTAAPFDTGYLNTGLTNGTTYFYAAFTKDTVGNWNNTVTAGTTADTGTPSLPTSPTTTIDEGTPGFGDTTVGPSYKNQAVDVFTLRTSEGTDTITDITVTGGGDTGSTNVSAARLFSDAGTIGVLDAGDTTIAASTFSGNTVTFSSLGLDVETTTANYIVAYSISGGANNGAKLDGYVSTVTASVGNDVVMQDTIDATLTVDAQSPGSITDFNATDFGDTTSTLTWTNPGDADLAEVKVVRKTGSYPTDHTDGTPVLDDTVSPFETSFDDSSLTNGTKYYYAAFAQDSYGNWSSSVVEGTNADTATPQALAVTFSNNTQDASGDTFYHGQIDRLMQSFQLATNGANGTWTQIGLSEYGSGTAADNVAKVRLFRDDGDSGFDAGDTELTLSPTTFSGESTTFTISGGETLTSASQEYFIVYDLTDDGNSEATVTIASRLTNDGSIIVTNGAVSGIDPAKSSGTATLLPNTVTVAGLDTAPGPTVVQGDTDDFLRLALTTDFGTATWTSVTVDRTGTGADADVAAVKIYKSSNTTWEVSDTLIGTGSFTAGKSTIDITDQTIASSVSDYYFVVYEISETADVSKTVGARVDSSGTITLAPPDGMTGFSFASAAPEIEESITDETPPTPPTNLTATSTVSSQVDLSWTAATDPESGISSYNIYRSYESFTQASLDTSATLIDNIAPAISYTDTTYTSIITGEDYWYAVSAINGVGLESNISNVATVTVTGKDVPHYDFDTTSNKCRRCHKLHGSPARAKVFRKYPEIQICFTCHDGTGSDYNILQVWTDSAHDGTETVLYSPDTYIQCVKCHNPHGTDPDYGTPFFLVRRVEENLCFRCHSSTGETPVASKNGWYIEDQMTSSVTVSRHAVVSTTTLNGQGYYPEGTATTADGLPGARIECTNCHNPMAIQRGTLGTSFLVRLIDPFNVWNLWKDNSRSVEPTFVNFCLNCHNSTGQPIATASATTIVPYTVMFPSMSTTDYPFFFGWDKIAYRDSTSAHNVNAVICGNCHNPHGSRNSRLMAFGYDADTSTAAWDYYYDDSPAVSNEENLCYQCHRASGRAGYTSAPDVQSQFAKTYRMPVTNSNRHKDTEQQSAFDDGNRHSECYDCHDPHKAKSGMRGKNNLAGGPINGAIGISVTNGSAGTTPTFSVKRGVTYEYELCFKCHSGAAKLGYDSINSRPYGDKAFEFNTNNSAFHPVETNGHNTSGALDEQFSNSGSGLTVDSVISCTDCHNNNSTSDASGWVVNSSTTSTTEAVGPHGSSEIRQLRDSYETDYTNYDPWNRNKGDLCFLCHDYNTLVNWQSSGDGARTNFMQAGDSLHELHMPQRDAAVCKNCHYNVHSNQQLQPQNTRFEIITSTTTQSYINEIPPTDIIPTTRLINFSPDVGVPSGFGFSQPTWEYRVSDRRRRCYINCHGGTMDPEVYTPPAAYDMP